ncbi:MAG: hypothetical protein JXR25_16175 [Pontiellaceae bacterium]|nr:hypothetical protein [Pontiellaceae bacterium]MBN2786358.1 hypothetical protein [Pontiellaceae bacterium]
MPVFGPAKYTEAWYRSLSAKEFFTERARTISGSDNYLSPWADPELKALGPDVRREIFASKFGLTWADVSKIPSTTINSMILDAQGITASSTAHAVSSAAEKDAMWATVRGFISGAGITGVAIISVIGVGAVILISKGAGKKIENSISGLIDSASSAISKVGA